MQNKDLVTIVVPAYNAEAFLKENIESILGQTYKNLEVIYVCDGCTDNTVDILMQYKADNRLKVCVQTENHGAAISRNIGMNMAKGDWIIFLDADDLFEPNMIEEMVKCTVEEKADMCCCYYECFDDVPNNKVHIANEMRKLYCSTYPVIETKKELRHIIQLVDKGPCTKLVHKSVYMREEVYFQDIPNANDVYYSMVAAMNTHRIVYIDKVFLHYRSGKGRKTLSTERNEKKNFIFEACDKLYEYILSQDKNKYLLRSFYNEVFYSIYVYSETKVLSSIIQSLKNKYFIKWGLDKIIINDELNFVNRVIYDNMMNNYCEISKKDISIQAKIEFVRMLSPKGCSIWGTGKLGCELLMKTSQTDIRIQHVFDSSKDKWGNIIYGYAIENFEEIQADNIIITTPQFFDEIKKQIENRAMNIYNLEEEIWKIP